MLNFYKIYKEEILISIVAIALTSLSFYTSHLKYATDDAFILYRYVDNIALGNGFVYNIGEKVLGSTTPLFTLLLAFFKYIFPNIYTPSITFIVNIVLVALSAGIFYRLAIKFVEKRWAILVSVVYILNVGRAIPEGMETPLFLLTLFVFLNALFEKRFNISAIFLSLCLLTRPDAGLVAVLGFIFWWQKTSLKQALKFTGVTILVALPWLIFATLYFGSPVPQSLLTKLHTNDIVNQSPYQALKVQLSSISKIYWGNIFDPDNIKLQVIFNLIPVLFFVFWWMRKGMTKDNWIIVAVPISYFISYSVSNPVMFSWHITKLEPMWILVSFVGVYYLCKNFKQKWLIYIVFALLLAGPVVKWSRLATYPDGGSKISAFETALKIKPLLRSGDRIMVNNYGMIGYTTGAYIIDPFGLINPGALKYYPIPDGCVDKTQQFAYPPKQIEDRKPEWLILSEKEVGDCFSKKGWFRDNYTPLYEKGQPILYIWMRVDR